MWIFVLRFATFGNRNNFNFPFWRYANKIEKMMKRKTQNRNIFFKEKKQALIGKPLCGNNNESILKSFRLNKMSEWIKQNVVDIQISKGSVEIKRFQEMEALFLLSVLIFIFNLSSNAFPFVSSNKKVDCFDRKQCLQWEFWLSKIILIKYWSHIS